MCVCVRLGRCMCVCVCARMRIRARVRRRRPWGRRRCGCMQVFACVCNRIKLTNRSHQSAIPAANLTRRLMTIEACQRGERSSRPDINSSQASRNLLRLVGVRNSPSRRARAGRGEGGEVDWNPRDRIRRGLNPREGFCKSH